jgi:predicted RNA binding protein YcfA (HicA-like mRNA interferase family)
MPFTYAHFRKVLQKSGFLLVRLKKHETWEKVLSDGTILQVRISHQHGSDIPTPLLHQMLRQANLSYDEFVRILRS